MSLFRKKPIVIEAEQFRAELAPLPFQKHGAVCCFTGGYWYVESANGRIPIEEGDWIVLEKQPDLPRTAAYPIKPAIFAATYDAVEA